MDILPAVVNLEWCYGRSNTEKESLKELTLTQTLTPTLTLTITPPNKLFRFWQPEEFPLRNCFESYSPSPTHARTKRNFCDSPRMGCLVWSKPTLDLMHVTLTARKQRVYSKLVFKTYKKALCNWLRKLSKRNVEFHCRPKAQYANTQ